MSINPNIYIIGLTGGIATGKSSVAKFFTDRGIPVVDADQLARLATCSGSTVLDKIVSIFGEDVLTPDKQLDRKRLASRIFEDPEQRRTLEELLHPEIKRLAEEKINEAAAAGHRYLVYMAPLLIEAGAAGRVDEVWVVTVSPEIQLERLLKRDGITMEQAMRIISSQLPLVEKERYGDVVIDNSGSEEETFRQLTASWSMICGVK